MTRFSFSVSVSSEGRNLISLSDFTLEPGKITVLFGESGIGKTLLAKTIFGLTDAARLEATVNGETYSSWQQSDRVTSFRKAGFFVLQEPSSQFNPSMTIREQYREADLARPDFETSILNGLWKSDGWQDLAGLFPQPFRPSGGEKQRFLLAMALKKMAIQDDAGNLSPDSLFILDEPTGSLDNGFRNAFLELLILQHQKQPFTLLLITHDYTLIPWLERHPSGISGSVSWKELSRADSGEHLLSRFDPSDFISWQDQLSPPGRTDGQILAELNSGVICHGRTLTFSSGPEPIGTLALKAGTLTYLKAASGVGKTTVARILMGLYPAENQVLTLCGINLSSAGQSVWKRLIWGKKASMAFQLADEALNPLATVRQVFTALHRPELASDDQILRYLTPVFLTSPPKDFLSAQVRFLSGGQKQRLNLMRSLACRPEVLILDEPLNGVDFKTIRIFIRLLSQILSEGTAILLISHNEDIFDRLTLAENRVNLTATSP